MQIESSMHFAIQIASSPREEDGARTPLSPAAAVLPLPRRDIMTYSSLNMKRLARRARALSTLIKNRYYYE
jgi:hypothetical protein